MIKKYKYLDHSIIKEIKPLEVLCCEHDQTTLKLELDYKLKSKESITGSYNEFLYYDDNKLVGYIGISSFGSSDLEVNGMVDPAFRRKSIFKSLFNEVLIEWQNRNKPNMLLLTDHESHAGINFLESITASYDYSEYEMHLENPNKSNHTKVKLVQAKKEDALELAKQNKIYFGDVHDGERELILINPEIEAEKGMYIFLVQHNNLTIGKVNLITEEQIGSIYGLGVKPEFRRKGFGREILLASIDYFVDLNCNDVMLQVVTENISALDLYLSVGFKRTSVMDYYKMESTNE